MSFVFNADKGNAMFNQSLVFYLFRIRYIVGITMTKTHHRPNGLLRRGRHDDCTQGHATKGRKRGMMFEQ